MGYQRQIRLINQYTNTQVGGSVAQCELRRICACASLGKATQLIN